MVCDRAAAERVRVVEPDVVPGVTEVGLNVALMPAGNPETWKLTGLAKPLESLGAKVSVIVADLPEESATDEDDVVTVKSSSRKLTAAEGPPPEALLLTATEANPPVLALWPGIEAVSWVELTKVVGSGLPANVTTDVGRKFVPFTVRTNGAPAGVFIGESEDIVGTELLTGATSAESGLSPLALIALTT